MSTNQILPQPIVVWCKSKAEYQQLMKQLAPHQFYWDLGGKKTDPTAADSVVFDANKYTNDCCINLKELKLKNAAKNWYEYNGYTIVAASNFLAQTSGLGNSMGTVTISACSNSLDFDANKCPDCKGSGWYIGAFEKDECKLCGGSGKLEPDSCCTDQIRPTNRAIINEPSVNG